MKEIVIIGNGDVTVDYSQLVNSADFVVRINEPRNYGGNSGTKIDALCVTNLSTPGRLFAKYQIIKKLSFIQEVSEIWFPRPSNYSPFQFWIKPFSKNIFAQANYRKHIVSRNALENKGLIDFTKDLYANCCIELDINIESTTYFPSTGYLTIAYIQDRFRYEDTCITLLGFSFQGTPCHKWDKERENVMKMLNDSTLNLKWVV